MSTPREALRRQREREGWTQETFAQALGVEVSTYRDYEAGRSTPRPGRRPKMAKLLKVTRAELDRMLDVSEVAAPNGQSVPPWLSLYASLEQDAARLWTFQPFTIPALLQTAEYAAAVESIAPGPVTQEGIRKRVKIRMARQGVLQRQPEPVHLSVVLDESVLHRVTGGPEVMAAQLDHLADMAEAPNVDLRVLPLDAGVHSASFGGFIVLASQGQDPQMVCVEDRTGIRYLEGAHAVDAHLTVFDHLCDHALTTNETIDLIRTTAKERYQ